MKQQFLLMKHNPSLRLAMTLSIMMIIGFLFMGCFALPYADDFGYVPQSVGGFFRSIYMYYLGWGDRYTAQSFTQLFATFLNHHYWAVPLILITGTMSIYWDGQIIYPAHIILDTLKNNLKNSTNKRIKHLLSIGDITKCEI